MRAGHTWDAEIQDVYRKVLPYFKDACVLSSPSFDDDIGAWDTSTTQVLFGDLVAAVEATIDDESARTKGFKPGTNAQRHRLHRIHQPGRQRSRLKDLIRASFRRVNVVSETDSEKEPPAAARPAARPQLSWRASAPEYGTF